MKHERNGFRDEIVNFVVMNMVPYSHRLKSFRVFTQSDGAKHLAFSRAYEDEILRLRLRMTLRYSLFYSENQILS